MNQSAPLLNVKAHDTVITHCLLCKTSNQYVVTSGVQDDVKLWNIQKECPIMTFDVEKKDVVCMDVNPTETKLCIATNDGILRIFNLQTATIQNCLITTVCFYDECHIVCGLSNNHIEIININKVNSKIEFSAHQYPITKIFTNSDSPHFYTIDESGLINVWDKRQLNHVSQFSIQNSSSINVTKQQTLLFSISNNIYTAEKESQFVATIPFIPSIISSYDNNLILLANSQSVLLLSSNATIIASLSGFHNIVDIGTHATNHITPIIEIQGSRLQIQGTVEQINESYLASKDKTVVNFINSNYLQLAQPYDTSSEESILIESEDSSYLISSQHNSTLVTDSSSIVISDDSILEEANRQQKTLQTNVKTKVIKPRLSHNIMRSSIQRTSEGTTKPITPSPRKSIALHSPVLPTSRLTPVVKHNINTNRTSIAVDKSKGQIKTSDMDFHDNHVKMMNYYTDCIKAVQTVNQSLSNWDKYWDTLNSLSNLILVCKCIDLCRAHVIIKKVHLPIVVGIIQRGIESGNEIVMLSCLRLLRHVLKDRMLYADCKYIFDNLNITLLNIKQTTLHNPNIKLYIVDCLNTIDSL